jgi:glycosyltransferase involved in cell wall biosynthesis
MKILIVSQVFWPENFKINDLCKEFINMGHEVTVITGKPNYPGGRFYEGYSFFSKVNDNYNGAKVYRIPLIPRGRATGIRLAINYISFTFFASIFALLHRKNYDFSFVFGVSPITAVLPAIVHRKVYKTKLILWVLDLWPESALVTGKLKSIFLYNRLSILVKFIYRNCDKIFISSKMMECSVSNNLDKESKIQIEYLPNWVDDSFFQRKADKHKYANLIPKGFIVMFAGNIGYGQDVPAIIKTAQILKPDGHIKFVFLGDGSERAFLEKNIKELDLEDSVFTLGSYGIDEMPDFYIHANAMLITLRDENIYSYTVPGKLQSYMASNKPIVGMINGEAAQLINNSQCGISVNAGNYEQLAEELLKLSQQPKSTLDQMGKNGFDFCLKNFKKEFFVDRILNSSQL